MIDEVYCPCGSGALFPACCGRYINQDLSVPVVESLMRSRYSAYVLHNESWLLQTWHPSTRPAQVALDDRAMGGIQWLDLKIVSKTAGSKADKEGTVEFIARYKVNGRVESLHETSRFVQEDGKWYYVDGEIHTAENASEKVGRNTACPCGSGKKYKRCCGR